MIEEKIIYNLSALNKNTHDIVDCGLYKKICTKCGMYLNSCYVYDNDGFENLHYYYPDADLSCNEYIIKNIVE